MNPLPITECNYKKFDLIILRDGNIHALRKKRQIMHTLVVERQDDVEEAVNTYTHKS